MRSPGPGRDRCRSRDLVANAAAQTAPGFLPTPLVFVNDRWPVRCRPTVSPTRQGDEGWNEIATLFGQHVLVLALVLGVRARLHQSGSHVALQSRGEDVGSDAETVR